MRGSAGDLPSAEKEAGRFGFYSSRVTNPLAKLITVFILLFTISLMALFYYKSLSCSFVLGRTA